MFYCKIFSLKTFKTHFIIKYRFILLIIKNDRITGFITTTYILIRILDCIVEFIVKQQMAERIYLILI